MNIRPNMIAEKTVNQGSKRLIDGGNCKTEEVISEAVMINKMKI